MRGGQSAAGLCLRTRRHSHRDVASWSTADFESVVDDLSAKGVAFETHGGPETDERGIHTFGGHEVVWFQDPDGDTLAVDNGGAPS